MIEPFDDMEKFFEDPMLKGFTPAIDVYETAQEVVIEAPLAGVNPKDVDISIENNVLTIRGEARKESEVDEKNYYRKEIRAGKFFRSVPLPSRVVADKAVAESTSGMLRITVPKESEVKPKSIKINIIDKQ